MTSQLILRAILLLFVLSLNLQVCGQTAMPREVLQVGQPVAIDGIAGSSFYVLTADGVIFRYLDAPSGMRYSARFQLPGITQSADLAFLGRTGSEAVFVTAWLESNRAGYIFQFSPDGKLIQKWRGDGRVSGLGVDQINNLIYYAAYDTNNLRRINPSTGHDEYVCQLPNSSGTGAVVVDSMRAKVYAADPTGGKIFQVDLASRKPTVLAEWKAWPSALRLDTNNQILYITDSLNGRLWKLNLRKQNAKPEPVFQFQMKSELSGVALGANHRLLIADSRTDRVYSLQAAE